MDFFLYLTESFIFYVTEEQKLQEQYPDIVLPPQKDGDFPQIIKRR